MEKILHVVYPFHSRVKENMEHLGFLLKESKSVNYRRGMNVISDTTNTFKGSAIFKMTFEIEDSEYENNKSEIDEYIDILEKRYLPLKKYRFCIPIIIISSIEAFVLGIWLSFVMLQGGPLNDNMWIFLVYTLFFGWATNETVLIMFYLFVAVFVICLGATIAFSIVMGVSKNKNKKINLLNDELLLKKRVKISPKN